MPLAIQSIDLYQIYDSVGSPTLEARINDHIAACPGGLSRSAYEAPIVPIKQALKAFEKCKKDLLGSFTQSSFDAKLSRLMPQLGAQATTALSLAFYHNEAAQRPSNSPASNTFPNLLGNVLGGGAHAPYSNALGKGKRAIRQRMSIQEILVMPRAKTLSAAIEANFKIWRAVGEELAKRGSCGLNYEAAWSADISDEAALAIASKAAKQARAQLGVDIAASQLFRKGKYVWSDKELDQEAHIARLLGFVKKYRLAYIEDPLHQDDFEGFSELLAATKGRALICGDDLIATNLDRLKQAAREHAINAVIIKPNQTGTVTGCLDVIAHARKNRIVPIVSHRSRETPDTAICRLAQVCPIAKFGIAGIRTVKLNGLLRLWHSAPKPRISRI